MSTSPHLLILCRDPNNASFRQRVGIYLPDLRARGIEPDVQPLAGGMLARRRQLRAARGFDAVLLQRKTLTAWDAAALRPRGAKLIYDFDDAVMYKTGPPVTSPHPARLRRFRRTARASRLVLAGNSLLAAAAREAGAPEAIVIPTGLDIARYTAKSEHAAAGPLRLVWIGSRSTLRQITSFLPVFEAIGQRAPGTVLRIIADAALAARHITVENIPWSREAEAALLAECDIGLSPLPDTPFTRGKCAFKIVQYMAAGLPVITSPVGANAEYVRDGETGLWAETHEQWLAAFDRLAGDAALRASMGRAGRAFAERHLARNVLAGRLCDAVNRCLAG